MTGEQRFGARHVTEADAPQWMHDQARDYVRRLTEDAVREAGLVPLDGVVVTRETWQHDDGRQLVTHRALAVGVSGVSD